MLTQYIYPSEGTWYLKTSENEVDTGVFDNPVAAWEQATALVEGDGDKLYINWDYVDRGPFTEFTAHIPSNGHEVFIPENEVWRQMYQLVKSWRE